MLAPRCILVFFLVLLICTIEPTYGRRGRGGGSRGGSRGRGSRGGGSRGGGSRDSGSSSSGTQIDRPGSSNSRPSPPRIDSPQPVRPSAPELPKQFPSSPGTNRQPQPSNPNPYNPDFVQPGRQGSGVVPSPVNQPSYGNAGPGNPPPYSAHGNAPPYSPQGNPPPYSPQGNPPPYSPHGNAPPYSSQGNPPPYSPQGNAPPYSPPVYPPAYRGPPQYGVHTGNVPHGVQQPQSPYPRQPGVAGNFPHGVQSPQSPYPRQPGMVYPPSGFGSPNYYVPGAYPGGTSIKPYKKKGLLGGLFSVGKNVGKKPKHHGMPSFGGGGISPVHMLIPAMAMRKSPTFFSRPSYHFWMSPYAIHHQHRGWGGSFDFDDDDYRGRCFRPRAPINGTISCRINEHGVLCNASCKENFTFSDNSTSKEAQCWHYSGHWSRSRYFPACKPYCTEECQNGGTCKAPGICRCSSEYRGDHCEHHILNCDIRKLARGSKISWVCSHMTNETLCKIDCRTPLKFESPPAEQYHCHVNGTWTPDSIPQCVPEPEGDKSTR